MVTEGFLEDFGAGVGLGNVTADTAALQAAMAAGASISGRYGVPFYYIAQGAVCASGARLSNITLKAKMGSGGFASDSIGTATRYDTAHCLLHWLNADGGGYNNLSLVSDRGGTRTGDYVCLPLCVTGGMLTKPFIGSGSCFIQGFTGLTGCVVFNSVGYGGSLRSSYHFDFLHLADIYTQRPIAEWTNAGGFIQVTGWALDGDITAGHYSERGTFGTVLGERVYLGGAARVAAGNQSDLVTWANTGHPNHPTGDSIIYEGTPGIAENVAEVLDVFGSGWEVKSIIGRNVESVVLKAHGGVGGKASVLVDKCGRYAVNLASSSTVECGNYDIRISGRGMGEYFADAGVLQAADATHATLAVTAPIWDNYFNAGMQVLIESGAHAGSHGTISAYNGTTKVATVASWSGGTPAAGDSYKVQITTEFRALDLTDGASAQPLTNCTVHVDGIENTGYMSRILKSNLVLPASTGNRVILHNDLGWEGNQASFLLADYPALDYLPTLFQDSAISLNWTPTLSAATTPPTGVTYSNQTGLSYRLGNLVYIRCHLILTSAGTGGVGQAQINGLPYPVVSSFTVCMPFNTGTTLTAGRIMQLLSVGSSLKFYEVGNTGSIAVAIGAIGGTSNIQFDIVYQTS
jgi:hypothetical protein